MSDETPAILGHGGLTGRQQKAIFDARYQRGEEVFDDEGQVAEPLPPLRQPNGAMPGNCRRTLSSPLPRDGMGGCRSDCPGLQRDGGCLLDVIRAAAAAGVEPVFEVDQADGYWDYAGEPIPGYEQVRGERPGELIGSFARDYSAPPPPPPPSFECPHCNAHVEQDPENFHFWCPSCGRNAKDD